jgi:hypothetical protein
MAATAARAQSSGVGGCRRSGNRSRSGVLWTGRRAPAQVRRNSAARLAHLVHFWAFVGAAPLHLHPGRRLENRLGCCFTFLGLWCPALGPVLILASLVLCSALPRATSAAESAPGKLEPQLLAGLRTRGEATFVVFFREKADLRQAQAVAGWGPGVARSTTASGRRPSAARRAPATTLHSAASHTGRSSSSTRSR